MMRVQVEVMGRSSNLAQFTAAREFDVSCRIRYFGRCAAGDLSIYFFAL